MKSTIPCRQAFTDTLCELAENNREIVVITSDASGSVTLGKFAEKFPQQFIEVGIAEQNAIGISAGLASCGKEVFVSGPACFYSSRSLEQLKVDIAYCKFPVKVVGVSGGVSYGALGSTHHSLHDIAAIRTFPGMHILLPSDAQQTRVLIRKMEGYPFPVYIRMGRGAVPDIYPADDQDFEPGKSRLLKEGNDLALIGTGETVYHCYQAALELETGGINARVIDMYSLKPVDQEAILKAAQETGHIITVEEHSIYGGLGSMVAEITSGSFPVPVKILGIPDEDAFHGTSAEIFEHYGLTASHIAETAKNFLKSDQPIYSLTNQ